MIDKNKKATASSSKNEKTTKRKKQDKQDEVEIQPLIGMLYEFLKYLFYFVVGM